MKLAYYIGKKSLREDVSIRNLLEGIASSGNTVVDAGAGEAAIGDADMLLSFGGDGTFLSAAKIAWSAGIPILGVNLGRLGFLAEAALADVAPLVESGSLETIERKMLSVKVGEAAMLAHNEVCINRIGSGAIGVDVTIDGVALPAYWGDGVLVATGAGSTAYNLSVGGPICLPSADVLVVSPIAPHNLGVRPLVIPGGSRVVLRVMSRGADVSVNADGQSVVAPDGTSVELEVSPKTLKCVKLEKSNFIEALRSRFFWGQDVRNSK